MNDVPVFCNYKQTVNGFVAFDAIVDVVDTNEKISVENRGEMSIKVETFLQKPDKSYVLVGDNDVALGQKVKIVFTSSNNFLPGRIRKFYKGLFEPIYSLKSLWKYI